MKLFLRYLIYLWHSKNERSIHSSLLLDLYQQSIRNRNQYYAFQRIEKVRQKLLTNNNKIKVTDFGAGSKNNHFPEREISAIAKTSLKKAFLAEILFKICNYLNAKTIVELGTSLGISTAYLASASSTSKVYTLEGCPNISDVAKDNFKQLKLKNIEVITGNIDENLSNILNKIDQLDIVYLDANHRYEPTMNYFQECLKKVHDHSILIFDDIHWSNEMQQAWEEIKKHPQVTVSVDIFHFGLVLFNSKLPKKHLILSTNNPFTELLF